jgi:hypothetical protein
MAPLPENHMPTRKSKSKRIKSKENPCLDSFFEENPGKKINGEF